MSNDLVLHDPDGLTFLPAHDTTARVWNLANSISQTEFVPRGLRGKPEAIMAAMLTGREVGIGAMHALRAIDVIDGKPSLSPELLHSMALRAGHDLFVAENDRHGCRVEVRRSEWPEDRVAVVTFDEHDGRIAGLVGSECSPSKGEHKQDRTTRSGNPTCACKPGYVTYPRAMYRARCVAEACRAHLPDVVERMGYTASELNPDALSPDETKWAKDVEQSAAEQSDSVDDADDESDDEIVDAEVIEDDVDDEPVDEQSDDDIEPEPDAVDEQSDEPTVDDAEERQMLRDQWAALVGRADDVAKTRVKDEFRKRFADVKTPDDMSAIDVVAFGEFVTWAQGEVEVPF